MNATIALFFLFGACFGLATFSHRHLFNEGPHGADTPQDGSALGNRIMWILTCTFLWPVMALSGLNTAWVLAKRRRARDLESR
jgi:hypothetical protein